MKADLEKIKSFNGDQFLIDLKKAYRVWVRPTTTGSYFLTTKKEVMSEDRFRKIHYTMYESIDNQLIMQIL